jgi:hypothetical protein
VTRCRARLAAAALALAFLPVPSRHATAAPPRPPATPPGVPSDAGLATRVITVRYRSVDDVYLLVSPALGPRGSIAAQPRQRTLTVVDTPASLEAIARLVAAYDVPPRSVEVSVQLILATTGAASPQPPPPPIRGVIEKLNALSTRWNDYRMVGAARILGTEGERSSLRVGDDYRIDFRIDQIQDESRLIRFKPFALARREPTVEGSERFTPVMDTVLNLRDSQLFIVGASKMERSNRALFMTITAALQQP